jgi:hypothetical protein
VLLLLLLLLCVVTPYATRTPCVSTSCSHVLHDPAGSTIEHFLLQRAHFWPPQECRVACKLGIGFVEKCGEVRVLLFQESVARLFFSERLFSFPAWRRLW